MPRYSEREAREAVAASLNYSEALRRLGVDPHGGNHRLFRRWVDKIWQIPTDHFDPDAARRPSGIRGAPLEEILVEGSTYSRASLKRRLFTEGLKEPVCELCGQSDEWRGARMAMILDHVNGVPNDNRLENLRIVCPNCAATLDTHCGRKNKMVAPRECLHCRKTFLPPHGRQRYCSRACGQHAPKPNAQGKPRPYLRRAERPPLEVLLDEVRQSSFSAVGRKYGVSDNAIRKWISQYYLETALARKERRDAAA